MPGTRSPPCQRRPRHRRGRHGLGELEGTPARSCLAGTYAPRGALCHRGHRPAPPRRGPPSRPDRRSGRSSTEQLSTTGPPTPNRQPAARRSPMRSMGLAKPRRLRGRSLSSSATASRNASSWIDRSVPLGKYCRSRPLVFSLRPLCHGYPANRRLVRLTAPITPLNRSQSMPFHCFRGASRLAG